MLKIQYDINKRENGKLQHKNGHLYIDLNIEDVNLTQKVVNAIREKHLNWSITGFVPIEVHNYYISFGHMHRHIIGDKVIDKNCVVQFKRPTMREARERAHTLFGLNWFTSYTEDEIKKLLHFFPRGIIELD